MTHLKIYKGGRTWVDRLLVWLANFLLHLRYRVKVNGLDKIREKGTQKILFLPNHIALVDPLILGGALYKDFHPRSIADFNNINYPFLGWASHRLGARAIPDMTVSGPKAKVELDAVLSETLEGLKNGENLLMYPAGRLKRQYREVLAATSATENLIKSIPGIRVILVRQNGLWGSCFSWASGTKPNILRGLFFGAKVLLANFIFFCPKRDIVIDLFEPEDFPKNEDRLSINRYLENFFNTDNWPNTHIRYYWWQCQHSKLLPEPQEQILKGDLNSVPSNVKLQIIEYLEKITGVSSIRVDQKLSYDLGLDSIKIAEIVAWLEQEFGFAQGNTDAYQTVGDVMLAATGNSLSTVQFDLKPIPKKWFKLQNENIPLLIPKCHKISDIFLSNASQTPDRVLFADQTSGVKTYRDVIISIFVLRPYLEKLPGDYLGIMFPASVAGSILYLTTMFSGKKAVMVNWTTGAKNILFSLQGIGVEKVITSRKLVQKLKEQGMDIASLENYFIYIEDIGKQISFSQKLFAMFKSYLSWRTLYKSKISDTAAVLFTSGSESTPKAVPLSHTNILTNIYDLVSVVFLYRNEVMLGILPAFHSFGLVATVIFPICASIRVVYYPNPTEARAVANIIHAYKVTMGLVTPTFWQGIIRACRPEKLQTIKFLISGAEKFPEQLWNLTSELCPNLKILEGYGITECSPVVSINHEDSIQMGSIGKILPSVQYKIVDLDTGEEVPEGTMGRLLVSGPSIFSGYLNYQGNPFVEFKNQIWYNTGDLVVQNSQKNLIFSGRLKRFVKLAGEMVSLPAIEESLRIKLSTPDQDKPTLAIEATEDENHAEIVLFTTMDIDRVRVNEIIRDAGLSAIHNVRRICKIDEIPLLGTGKIDYRSLKKLLQNRA